MNVAQDNDAPIEIKQYLDEIAHRLWSNNAAVMVGAGFSQNAIPVNPTSESLPSWKDLGDRFYQKLHGGMPSGDDAKYLSLLKLAEQVQATFGRSTLDDLIVHTIPDLGYNPSALHIQLLSLPWTDIFTTNYDTLLERTRVFVSLKHYEVVSAKQHLLYANKPRIVKLHGSFSSPPFTITEEDYRRYPNDHAPFVNTVRQSLLENTLCLIGFSGDDPNFLQWIGWIRDHIGEDTSSKIYLIGIFESQTEADWKLLDRRGIITVDLSFFDRKVSVALEKFLNYLQTQKSRASVWPVVSDETKSWGMRYKSDKIIDVIDEWRRQRKTYPGWIVIPDDRRRDLWRYTEDWSSHLSRDLLNSLDNLEAPLDFDLAFELAWRLERCLIPLIGNLPTFLEEIVRKYGNKTPPNIEISEWTETSLFEAVSTIRLWLLRHYREQGLKEKWEEVEREMLLIFDQLLPEHKVRFQLEIVLQALFCLDPTKAKLLLTDWRVDGYFPFLEAKRAALLAELGETTLALQILNKSLSDLRQKSSLNPVTEDFTLVSQESVVMLMIWALQKSRTAECPNDDSKDDYALDELSERWDELARYKCDPRREIAFSAARVQHLSAGWRYQSKTHRFDLGSVTNTFHFGFDKEVVAAYELLRLYEDIGLPYRIGNNTFVKAPVQATLLRIRHYSPHWALVNIMRLSDPKVADKLFDREYLDGLKCDEVDRFCEIYLPALVRTIDIIDKRPASQIQINQSLAKTLPEIFSRLCYKSSPSFRIQLVDVLRAIYESKRRLEFQDVKQFARRLFNSMSTFELAQIVLLLIDFPIPELRNEIEKREFVNPLVMIDSSEVLQGNAFHIAEKRIDELLDQFENNTHLRDWMSTTLVWLHNQGKLNNLQSERLGKLIWRGIGSEEVPLISGFHSFVCLEIPHPEVVDGELLVKLHIQKQIRAQITNHHAKLDLDEFRSSARFVNWSKAEAIDTVAQLSNWWRRNRMLFDQHAPTPFGVSSETMRNESAKIIQALSEVFSSLPMQQNEKVEIDTLHEFLADLKAENVPTLALEASILNTPEIRSEKVLHKTMVALVDSNDDVVADALFATKILMQKLSVKPVRDDFDRVIKILIQGIQWRHRPILAGRLSVVTYLVNHYPQFLSTDSELLVHLLDGLKQLAEETSIGIIGNDRDGIIKIRAAAAALAFEISCYYQQFGTDEPETVQHWRDICSNQDEFVEIRNSWNEIQS